MQFLIDIALSLVYLYLFLLICAWAWRFWMMYVNQKFLHKFNEDCILLEIKLPREIMKSPLATEVALTSLLQSGGVGHWYARDFQGNLPAYSSLEIASLEGVLHFYIRIHKKYKTTVESNFYAQYPGIEIVEADDYTKLIRYHHLSKDVSMWGATYPLSKTWNPINPKTGKEYPDPEHPNDKKKKYSMKADFLPIKTYVDYGLDKDPKEEFKTDPITPLLEFMGSVGKGEYFWYQILVQDESVYEKKFPKFYVNEVTHEHLSLKDMADARKKQIRTSGYKSKGDKVYDEYGVVKQRVIGKDDKGVEIKEDITYQFEEPKAESKKEIDLIPEDKETLEAINRKLSKPLALVVIRLIYIAKKENYFSSGVHVQNILGFGKPYKGANSFGLNPTEPYDFPWQNLKGRRVHWRSEELFDAYVEREGFFPHAGVRKSLDAFEDQFFYPHTMK